MKKLMTTKGEPNMGMILTIAAIVAAVVFVTAVVVVKRMAPKTKADLKTALPDMTLEERGKAIAADILTRDGCKITFKPGKSSASIADHVELFVRPAAELARKSGAAGLDATTTAVFAMLLPGCGKPEKLKPFDLDRAVAGDLSATEELAFKLITKSYPEVRLYLVLRGIIAGIA